ncbi:MAG: hypothetical protein COB04_02335 [Gammaproteobacteria bacterium]|nr:MAG: hypothetical protein COB04_02335 [Gammaproteobacteria bacterium]
MGRDMEMSGDIYTIVASVLVQNR